MKITKRMMEMILCMSKQNLSQGRCPTCGTFRKTKAITLKEYLTLERIIKRMKNDA